MITLEPKNYTAVTLETRADERLWDDPVALWDDPQATWNSPRTDQ